MRCSESWVRRSRQAIDTFAEVRFKNAEGKADIPDGAIVCQRGGKRWTCLVEVKTGSATLKDEQVGRYLDIARDHGFDGVLTISNQITHSASESPVVVDGRKLRKAKPLALLLVAHPDRGGRAESLPRAWPIPTRHGSFAS